MITVLTIAFHASIAPGQDLILAGTQTHDIRELAPQRKAYVLKGAYVVPAGKELRLEAGTVMVADRESSLSVSGKILVEGTQDAPVIIRGKGSGYAYWKGLSFKDSTGSAISYGQVSGAATAFEMHGETSAIQIRDSILKRNGCAIKAVRGKMNLVNCLISESKESGIQSWCQVDLVSCTVVRNGEFGLYHYYAGPVRIEKCVFSENGQGGIRTRDLIEAHNSILTGNRKYDVFCDSANADRDFSGNWWGAQATRRLIQKGDTADLPGILDGHDDPKMGLILLEGFLKKAPKDCGYTLAQDGRRGRR